jgi:hypothetical protein
MPEPAPRLTENGSFPLTHSDAEAFFDPFLGLRPKHSGYWRVPHQHLRRIADAGARNIMENSDM